MLTHFTCFCVAIDSTNVTILDSQSLNYTGCRIIADAPLTPVEANRIASRFYQTHDEIKAVKVCSAGNSEKEGWRRFIPRTLSDVYAFTGGHIGMFIKALSLIPPDHTADPEYITEVCMNILRMSTDRSAHRVSGAAEPVHGTRKRVYYVAYCCTRSAITYSVLTGGLHRSECCVQPKPTNAQQLVLRTVART